MGCLPSSVPDSPDGWSPEHAFQGRSRVFRWSSYRACATRPPPYPTARARRGEDQYQTMPGRNDGIGTRSRPIGRRLDQYPSRPVTTRTSHWAVQREARDPQRSASGSAAREPLTTALRNAPQGEAMRYGLVRAGVNASAFLYAAAESRPHLRQMLADVFDPALNKLAQEHGLAPQCVHPIQVCG
jgi:hypothetical protein